MFLRMSLFMKIIFIIFLVFWNFRQFKCAQISDVDSQIQNFQRKIEDFSKNVLSVDHINRALETHFKYISGTRVENGEQEFRRIFTNIQIHYAGVQKALKDLVTSIESGQGSSPPGTNRFCCRSNPGLVYNGRFRQEVDTNHVCFGKNNRGLQRLITADVIDVFKNNLKSAPSLSWQYFSDVSGQFVQYPTSNRLCDGNGPTSDVSSPLTKSWFVEKLHMERKNLVVVVDSGLHTKQMSSSPGKTRARVIIDAVQLLLTTLTPQDKVNIVLFPYNGSLTTATPSACSDKLFIANPRNLDILKKFLDNAGQSNDQPDLSEGLKKAYQLLQADALQHKNQTVSKMVVLVLDGQGVPDNVQKTTLLESIARYQKNMSNSIRHFVYTLGEPNKNVTVQLLTQIADQNRQKLTVAGFGKAQPWPMIPSLVENGTIVGPEGSLDLVKNEGNFSSVVSSYFRKLPPQVDTSHTAIAPVIDPKSGVGMTLAVPVYNNRTKTTIGVAAVDAALASVFSDVVNYDLGTDSYSYLLETRHGHVLLHPKLKDPAETYQDDSIFPPLDIIEPDLSVQQRGLLLAAEHNSHKFNASVKPGRSSFSAETHRGQLKSPCTVHYGRIRDTYFVVVLVHFKTDVIRRFPKPSKVPNIHAPYHRLDVLYKGPELNKPDESQVCHLYGKYVAINESVIKFAPGVFDDSEMYKYSRDTRVSAISRFLAQESPVSPSLIRNDTQNLIQHIIQATSDIDQWWRGSAKTVLERFFGTASGVFRIFPGVPFDNSFNHILSKWFKQSVSVPDKYMFQRGKLSEINRGDVIIISKALALTQKEVEGVVGATVTPRHFTSLLLNSVSSCYNQQLKCHIVDSSGYILDSTFNANNVDERHLTVAYPDVAGKLIQSQTLKSSWCTGMSDGYHKLLYSLIGNQQDTKSAICQQFSLKSIARTNLFVLVLADRQTNKCKDGSSKVCSSCNGPAYKSSYNLTLPQCQSCLNGPGSSCQCPCYCDTDFDQCSSQYRTGVMQFPVAACFYSPFHPQLKQIKPAAPGPNVKHCVIPCAAIEDLTVCQKLKHCKLSSSAYKTCIWKDAANITEYSHRLPTTTVPPPPTHPRLPKKTPIHPPKPTKPHSSTNGPPKPPGLTQWTKKKPVSTKGPPKPPRPTHSPTKQTNPTKGQTSTVSTVSVTLFPGSHSLSTVSGQAQKLGMSNDSKSSNGGLIAGVVIACLVALALVLFIIFKLYGKKFGGSDFGKYLKRRRSSVFDSALFSSGGSQVALSTAPASTVPYEDMSCKQ